MSRLIVLYIVFAAVATNIGCVSNVKQEIPEQATLLIQKAGNADDDKVRLACLKELQQLPDLDESLKKDLDRFIRKVNRWVNGKRLEYFSREVLENKDYDFKIDPTSPLYPLTYLYRGRMLAWVTIEYGSFKRNQERRREYLDRARRFFELASKAYPENRIARMYLGQPIEPQKKYLAVAGAPGWAIYQRQGLERLSDIIEWWIDNRMQETGEYGGGWGDDCEMWRWWVSVLIGFEDPKITAAQQRFSEALMSQPHMKEGYTKHLSDVQHTAEDSADTITPMMYIAPNDQKWNRRALRLAELMEKLWTARNQRGFLQFKSTLISANRISELPHQTCDTVFHPRAVQPALLYWQRTKDEKLKRLFSDWMDTWVDAAARAERGKPAGIIPSAIHFPDGNVGGLSDDWWDPNNYRESSTLYRWPSSMSLMTHTLLLTYHMTGDDKYLEPIRSMAKIRLEYLKKPPKKMPKPGTKAWCASKLGGLAKVLTKYRLITANSEFDELIKKDASPYVNFLMTEDRKPLIAALRKNAEALRINFEGYTSEVRYTDRVLRFPSLFSANGMYIKAIPTIQRPETGILYATVTGDPGKAGYFPLNAVRWLTPARDIAALVTKSTKDAFCAEIFHFGNQPRRMSAEFYLLSAGWYTFTLKSKDNGKETTLIKEKLILRGWNYPKVPFKLPPQKLCTINIYRD